MYVGVCVYVCTCVRVYVCVYVYMYVHVCTYMCVCVYRMHSWRAVHFFDFHLYRYPNKWKKVPE